MQFVVEPRKDVARTHKNKYREEWEGNGSLGIADAVYFLFLLPPPGVRQKTETNEPQESPNTFVMSREHDTFS